MASFSVMTGIRAEERLHEQFVTPHELVEPALAAGDLAEVALLLLPEFL